MTPPSRAMISLIFSRGSETSMVTSEGAIIAACVGDICGASIDRTRRLQINTRLAHIIGYVQILVSSHSCYDSITHLHIVQILAASGTTTITQHVGLTTTTCMYGVRCRSSPYRAVTTRFQPTLGDRLLFT
jgi:hypothetical protein